LAEMPLATANFTQSASTAARTSSAASRGLSHADRARSGTAAPGRDSAKYPIRRATTEVDALAPATQRLSPGLRGAVQVARTRWIICPRLRRVRPGRDDVQAAGQHETADTTLGRRLGDVVGADHVDRQELFPRGGRIGHRGQVHHGVDARERYPAGPGVAHVQRTDSVTSREVCTLHVPVRRKQRSDRPSDTASSPRDHDPTGCLRRHRPHATDVRASPGPAGALTMCPSWIR